MDSRTLQEKTRTSQGRASLRGSWTTPEAEITQPSRGIYLTRYFVTRWMPTLGPEAGALVLALRMLADRDGRSYASQATIASMAGMGVRSVGRWLASDESALGGWPEARRAQRRLLHEHFLRSKETRFIGRALPGAGARRTTSAVTVVLDDPVHPDDLQRLEEAREGSPPTVDNSVDNSRALGQSGRTVAPPEWPSRSYLERSIQNVKSRKLDDRPPDPIPDPVPRTQATVFKPSPDPGRVDALADHLGEWLARKSGDPTVGAHRSLSAHRRAINLLGEDTVREGQRRLEDRLEAGRCRRADPVRNPSAAFWGILRNLAQERGVSLAQRGST